MLLRLGSGFALPRRARVSCTVSSRDLRSEISLPAVASVLLTLLYLNPYERIRISMSTPAPDLSLKSSRLHFDNRVSSLETCGCVLRQRTNLCALWKAAGTAVQSDCIGGGRCETSTFLKHPPNLHAAPVPPVGPPCPSHTLSLTPDCVSLPLIWRPIPSYRS